MSVPMQRSDEDGPTTRSAVATPLDEQARLVHQLAAQLETPGAPVQLFETHISWVIVLPTVAFKIKRARRLPFVDYTTLEARRFFCDEEIRLNGPLAPELYLGVVAIGGTPEAPRLDVAGPVIEYAVKMRAFDQAALWSHRLREGQLCSDEARQLARLLAQFHQHAPGAPAGTAWGSADAVIARTEADLDEIAFLCDADNASLVAISAWHAREHGRMAERFRRRKASGRVRECHGDLHCGNILTIDGRVQLFDAIEFNPDMRWIDVAQDFAFVWMDLQFNGRTDLAARLLSDYLQQGGDDGALTVLPYYRVQRALVRCKVALHRAVEFEASGEAERGGGARQEAQRYLAFGAACCREPGKGALLITHGFSGSGKSGVCEQLVEPLGALHVRSDIERKRLFGMAALDRAGAAPGAGIYTRAAGLATYRRLARVALRGLAAGLTVLVDATFLARRQRDRFRRLAGLSGARFGILSVRADASALAARVAGRAGAGGDPSDADLAVLSQQYGAAEPLGADESDAVIVIDNCMDSTLRSENLMALVAERMGPRHRSSPSPR